MKHLIHEVHQPWEKPLGRALGCSASPAEERVQLEAHPLPTPAGVRSLQKAPEKPAPNIL